MSEKVINSCYFVIYSHMLNTLDKKPGFKYQTWRDVLHPTDCFTSTNGLYLEMPSPCTQFPYTLSLSSPLTQLLAFIQVAARLAAGCLWPALRKKFASSCNFNDPRVPQFVSAANLAARTTNTAGEDYHFIAIMLLCLLICEVYQTIRQQTINVISFCNLRARI